jgi:hypothetical protein
MHAALTALCAMVLSLGTTTPPASAAVDPIFTYAAPVQVPPGNGFNGPCGLTVDSVGNVYVSDYYHHVVDVFGAGSSMPYLTQLKEVDPASGPCGLASDSTGKVYVNVYHRNVIRYTPAFYPPGSNTAYSAGPVIDTGNPTGVAVGASNAVYVNNRDRITVYSSAGVQTGTIGVGSIGDGYGLAATATHVFVADAASNTVKVYETATGALTLTIAGPPGGFASLRDSAVAVDRVNGHVYVADRRGSPYSERPESTIQVFNAAGAYVGHLKYNVIDAAPVGLAVDNSISVNQGRVYVTSGNTTGARVYAYTKEAATTSPPLPSPSAVASAPPSELPDKAERRVAVAAAGDGPSTATASEIAQDGNLRLDVSGQISPKKLPRKGTAPIAVEVGWSVATTDGAPPPKLKRLAIEINRAGRFDLEGLPTCPYAKIQPASTGRALANCRSALVGRGSFKALIGLAGQESYVTQGEMLIFNGLRGKKPVLYGQIYSASPFANSFVIPFALKEIDKGRYGTSLTATLPAALRAWGSLTEIQMRLKRDFAYEGRRRSFISAGCPAPKGFDEVPFALARTSFEFLGGLSTSVTLTRACKARG